MLRAPSFGCPILRKLTLWPGVLPLDPAGGSAPNPTIGSCSVLAMVRAPPLFLSKFTPMALYSYRHVRRVQATVGNRLKLYIDHTCHFWSRRQLLSTQDWPLSLFISHSPMVGIPLPNLSLLIGQVGYMLCIATHFYSKFRPSHLNVCYLVFMWQLHGLAIWQNHMPAIWIPYKKHMALPYAFYMASIQQAYGKARCLMCGMHMVSIWLNHIATTWIPSRRHLDLHKAIILHSHMAATWYLYFIIYPLCLYGLHMASIWQSNMVHYQMKTTWNSYGIYVVFI